MEKEEKFKNTTFEKRQQENKDKSSRPISKEREESKKATTKALKELLKTGKNIILQSTSHLEAHTKRNSNTKHINYKVYHLLCEPSTFVNAYANISKNKGALTKGVDLDQEVNQFFGLTQAEAIAKKFKQHCYKWSPVRRTWIPKPGKTTKRPIDTPTQEDRIVQEAIRGILEAIYEPEFQEFHDHTGGLANNWGFRPKLSTIDALDKLRIYGQRATYGIEGDIVSAYNNVNHDILIGILEKRIQDKQFLQTIKDLLKAGIMERNHYQHSLIGTPQGGIVSPLLFNIYLFQLDKFIYKEIITPLQQTSLTKTTKHNPPWKQAQTQKGKYLKLLKKPGIPRKEMFSLRKEVKIFTLLQFKYPSKIPETLPKEGVYARYADDWLLLVTATKTEAHSYKEKISEFISSELKMQLDPQKTLITPITEGIDFLGYSLKMTTLKQIKIIKVLRSYTNQRGDLIHERFPKRTTSRTLTVYPSANRLIKNLLLKKFCEKTEDKKIKYFPKGHPTIAQLTEFEIVKKYSQIMQGICIYYRPFGHNAILNWVSFILQYSCAKTIARRKKITLRQVFALYGKNLTIEKQFIKNGENKTQISRFTTFSEIKKRWDNNPRPLGLKPTRPESIEDPFKTVLYLRTKIKTYLNCCICNSDKNVAHHHINSLRSIKDKTKDPYKVLRQQINRLQIPVCADCHLSITNGTYDRKKPIYFYNDLGEAIAKA